MRRAALTCVLLVATAASGCGSSATSTAGCDAARRLAAAHQTFSETVHFTPDSDARTLLAIAHRGPRTARPLLAAYDDLAGREPSLAADLRGVRSFTEDSVARTARARTIDQMMAAIEQTLTGPAHDPAEAAGARVATWADRECSVPLDLP